MNSQSRCYAANKSKFIRRVAFTLAEVLIVLGIIGIVAEMTIPTLMNNVQDQAFKTGWKKAVSEASQAYLMASNTYGSGFGGYDCNTSATTDKWNYFKAQFSTIKECSGSNGTTVGNCWGTKLTTPDPSAGCGYFQGASMNTNDAFVTKDGMTWMAYGGNGKGYCALVAVDVNGAKGPNKWGVDSFSFDLEDQTIGQYGACINDNGNSQNYLFK